MATGALQGRQIGKPEFEIIRGGCQCFVKTAGRCGTVTVLPAQLRQGQVADLPGRCAAQQAREIADRRCRVLTEQEGGAFQCEFRVAGFQLGGPVEIGDRVAAARRLHHRLRLDDADITRCEGRSCRQRFGRGIKVAAVAQMRTKGVPSLGGFGGEAGRTLQRRQPLVIVGKPGGQAEIDQCVDEIRRQSNGPAIFLHRHVGLLHLAGEIPEIIGQMRVLRQQRHRLGKTVHRLHQITALVGNDGEQMMRRPHRRIARDGAQPPIPRRRQIAALERRSGCCKIRLWFRHG